MKHKNKVGQTSTCPNKKNNQKRITGSEKSLD